MVLRLGDISFGVGADTANLRKGMEAMARFGDAVDRNARRVSDGSKTIQNALQRQEKTISDGLQRILNLQESLRSSGAPQQFAEELSTAFEQLATSLQKNEKFQNPLQELRINERFSAL